MVVFSAHVADTSVVDALRRKTLDPGAVAGLRGARNGTAAPFSRGLLPRPQPSREVMVAWWDDEDALDRFLIDDPAGREYASGWHVRMELMRAVGVWPGLTNDMAALVGPEGMTMDGPTIALTIGTAYLKTLVSFLRVNSGLEDQFVDNPDTLWGTAFTNLPQLLVGTLTVWPDTARALDYMKTGAHGAAVEAHYDPAKDPTGHTFVTGGGFFGFRPLSAHGALDGRNPVPAGLL